MEALKILMLEDSPYDVELVQYELKKGGINFITKVVDTKADFIRELGGFKPDIILSDHSMPQFNSIEALKIYKEKGIGVPFVLVTGSVSEEFAVQAILNGASDYLLKTNLTRLPSAVTNALDSWRAVREKEKAEKEIKQMNVFLNQVMDSQPIIFYISKISGEESVNYFISKNVKNITGYEVNEFLENPKLWFENIYPTESETVIESFEKKIADGGGDIEYRWKCADDTYKWFVDNFTVVKDENGEELIHGAWIDITKLKNADLRKLLFSKGMEEMLFMISHKVRHSVAQIRGLSNLIEDEIITEEDIKRIAEYMKEPANSLELYTKQLTDLMDDLKKRNNNMQ
jgi:CheY-like chemotaxis protein